MRCSLQVNLQGAVGDRADDERNHQPQKLINIKFSPLGRFADGIKKARTGDDKKERHHPPGGENVPELHPDVCIDIFHMPVAQIKKSGAVIQKNDQYGQYSQPVEFISSI